MINRRKFLQMLGIGAAALPAVVMGAKEPKGISVPFAKLETIDDLRLNIDDEYDFDDDIVTNYVTLKDRPPQLWLRRILPREDGWFFDSEGPYLMSISITHDPEEYCDSTLGMIVALSRSVELSAQFMYHDLVYDTVMVPFMPISWSDEEAMKDRLLTMFKEQILSNSLA